MYQRKQTFQHVDNQSFFLWGARQTGKSTLLNQLFPNSLKFDLLLSNVFRRLQDNPELFRESVLRSDASIPIIVDEIQKIPILLDEVHWLIENGRYRFVLSGSSSRKILRSGVNLLGGRAFRYELYPLSYSEIPEFDLTRALNHGLLPRHYDATNPYKMFESYIHNYLEDEIIAETQIRNAETFSKFLDKVAFSNGEIVNYTNIATECNVSGPTVKEYFKILIDTLIGSYVPSFQKNPKRRVIAAPKFFLFDIGIANYLLKRKNIEFGSIHFGFAFEHFIYHELRTYSEYSGKKFEIRYWRTSSQFEVDFILGDHEVAIEVKSTDNVLSKHLKGIYAFMDEYPIKQKIVVSMDSMERLVSGDIMLMHWKSFLDKLWGGEIM